MTSETIISADNERVSVSAHEPVSPARGARRFGAAFLAAFAIVWCAVMVIHFLGNPDGVFPSPRNPSRRELPWKARQFDRLIREGRAPSVLVLGSSRMMQVLPQQVDQMTGGRTFNFAVPGSTPLDMLAQLRFALERGAPIKRVLIGIDDQAMFGLYDTSHEMRIVAAPGVFRQLPLMNQLWLAIRLPAQVKPELTWSALQRTIDPPPMRLLRPESTTLMFLDDGYVIYPRRVLTRRAKTWDPRKEINDKAQRLRRLGDAALLFPDGAKISEGQIRRLTQLLEFCRQNQIQATVILTPVQADFADLTMRPSDKQTLRRLSDQLKRICAKRQAEYRDLNKVESFHGLPWEWTDFSHMLAENMRRLVNVALGQAPEQRLDQLPDDFSLMRNPSAVNSLNTP